MSLQMASMGSRCARARHAVSAYLEERRSFAGLDAHGSPDRRGFSLTLRICCLEQDFRLEIACLALPSERSDQFHYHPCNKYKFQSEQVEV